MKIYLLWFNEWEANYCLGIFDTKEQAEKWKSYFIANPTKTNYYGDMVFYSKRDDYDKRFDVEERIMGQLHSDVKVDNLKYVEHLFTENDNAQETGRIEPPQG